MSTLDQKFGVHPEVVDTELDMSETALLHLGSKIYYSLNATGVRVWQGLKQGLTLNQISKRLQEEFDVDAQTANRGVLELIEDLSQQQLVQVLDP
jgi:hypothetical protein